MRLSDGVSTEVEGLRSARAPDVDAIFKEAVELHKDGNTDKAEGLYRQILAARPDHAGSLHLLGVIEHQRGNYEAAVRQIDAALKIDPTLSEAFNNRANAVRRLGRLEGSRSSRSTPKPSTSAELRSRS